VGFIRRDNQKDPFVTGNTAVEQRQTINMNIFRLCGDMSHLFSIIVLLLRLRVAKNAQGTSVFVFLARIEKVPRYFHGANDGRRKEMCFRFVP
jgi:hypothetical protein